MNLGFRRFDPSRITCTAQRLFNPAKGLTGMLGRLTNKELANLVLLNLPIKDFGLDWGECMPEAVIREMANRLKREPDARG